MAYYDENEEDQIDPNAPQTTGPQSSTISGQGSSSAPAVAATAAKTPDNPGNFVGIQQYLAQNKPQAAKLGETVSNYVTDQGEGASEALAQGQTRFNEDVGKNTIGLNQDLFNQAKQTPEQVAADEAKKAEFKKMRDAEYQGPSSFEETDYYQPINMQIQNALGTANNTQSATGRSALLGDVAKHNNQKVSRGASNLDAALLAVSPNSKESLAKARESVLPLQNQVTQASQVDAQKAAAAKGQTEATHKAIQDAFAGPTGVQSQLQSSLEAKSAGAINQSGTDADAVLELLKSGNKNISDAQLGLLGISRNQYNGLLNDQKFYKDLGKKTNLDDLTQFATKQVPGDQINPQNIASQQDYARYAALNDLMDTSNGFLNDPSQAGKAKTDALDFNFDAAPNALNDRINSFLLKNYGQQSFDFNNNGAHVTGKPDIDFGDMNSEYNLNTTSPAKLAQNALDLSEIENAVKQQPEQPGLQRAAEKYAKELTGLQAILKSINDAYETKLSVPQDYVNKAKNLINANIMAAFKQDPSSGKTLPDDAQIDKAANISAYTTFLNELSGNSDKIRAPKVPAMKL